MQATADMSMARPGAAWGAVGSMALCVAVLIASEFMPVSLLTPIATDLGVTEGQAGQAISISGFFAVVTSLFIAGLIRTIDRKVVLASFSLLLIVSGVIVTIDPDYRVLMIGRALLGIAIGGFWSMSTAVVMRLLPRDAVPNGLAMLNAGNAIAATISAPLGSYLGGILGWRGAFFFVVPLALLALVWQWIAMPSLPPRGRPGRGNVFRLLARAGRTWHDSDPPALHGAVRALHLPQALPRDSHRLFRCRAFAGVPGGRPRRSRRNLGHQPTAGQAPIHSPYRYSGGDGRDCRPAYPARPLALRRYRSPRPLGVLRHRGAGRVGHVACPRHARRGRSRRRPSGRRHPVRHHDWGGRRRPDVRCRRLVERAFAAAAVLLLGSSLAAFAAWRNWENPR